MTSRGGKNRRKNYFIDRQFQSLFILKFCSLVILASALTGILMYHWNRQTTTVAFENLRIIVKTTADFIAPVILQILITVSIFISMAAIIITLFTSHRIAGPVYKLMTEIGKMSRLDFSSPIRIRATDQLQKAALETEAMRVRVSGELEAIKKDWGALKQDLSGVRDRPGENEKAGINDRVKKIDAALSRFKTGS
jgi:signal transduction histidine kinase